MPRPSLIRDYSIAGFMMGLLFILGVIVGSFAFYWLLKWWLSTIDLQAFFMNILLP